MSKPLSKFFSSREKEIEYYKKLQQKETNDDIINTAINNSKRTYIEDMGFSSYKKEYSDWSW